ncbi:MAG: LicD family protein [Alphaproteobacteria bacterium]|nr:LicD family protein [Alphaproteobacteria bacterium]
MNKTLCNLICFFIPKKKNRHHFRKKYGSKQFSFSKNPLLLQEIQCNLEAIKRMQCLTVDITKMPPATGNLKMVQDCSVALLNYFDQICKKHNITYWIDSGTLIGHIRHNGFIPWDDDIDICMMRDDYEKLFNILDDEFSQNGFKYARSEITRLYYKNTPAQVDIFPIDIGFQKDPLTGTEKEQFIVHLNNIKASIKCDFHTNLPLQQPVCSFDDICKALKQKTKLFNGKESVDNGFLFYGIWYSFRITRNFTL